LVKDIPNGPLSRYQTVAKNRDGQGMAPVLDGLCQICRLSIPPQLFNDLQRNEKLINCPNCARIVYWKDHPDFKPKTEESQNNGQSLKPAEIPDNIKTANTTEAHA
jgi:hypothetical protein